MSLFISVTYLRCFIENFVVYLNPHALDVKGEGMLLSQDLYLLYIISDTWMGRP